MAVIYVARSVQFGKWASDVGLSKHVFKVGIADEPVKAVIEAGWSGETDWTLVRREEAGDVTEAEALDRVGRKEKPIEALYYPRLKGAVGLFKVSPSHVENYFLVSRALSGDSETAAVRLKVTDFANYLIAIALRRSDAPAWSLTPR
ncbi:MAG: hypothetical protein P4M00_03405 [Azospirillaceae bacterium]|nr:hypothetical protein [Azospirillaceae bacterium]